ncbi:hypothetical protein N9L68_00935 [bacterium]|nr:hypothetical protein [bacterium]
MPNPRLPSQADVEAHELTHLPFRNWCRHCVAARGKELAHHKQTKDRVVPEFHMDYCFPGDKHGVAPLTVIVMRERLTRMTMASLVTRKGAVAEVAERICHFFKEAGSEHTDIILKNDQEEAIEALAKEVGRKRRALGQGKIIPEESPKAQRVTV